MQTARPEELVNAESPRLRLELTCRRCDHSTQEAFDWACIDPHAAKADEPWDGVMLSRVVRCSRCGAEDDYEITPFARMFLSVHAAANKGHGRVIMGTNRLYDGTEVRRPSQALAHLRGVVARDPDSAEALRRLGNTLERFGDPDAALPLWERAVELDPEDLEVTYSLASALWLDQSRRQEAFGYLCAGFRLLPGALRKRPDLSRFGGGLVNVLLDVMASTDEPLALMAAWQTGAARDDAVVTVSSVDLRVVEDFERLSDFVIRNDLLSLGLTAELPEERATLLERELNSYPSRPVRAVIPPRSAPAKRAARRTKKVSRNVRAVIPPHSAPAKRAARRTQKVSRNAPCPCGSGRKYKNCCAR